MIYDVNINKKNGTRQNFVVTLGKNKTKTYNVNVDSKFNWATAF